MVKNYFQKEKNNKYDHIFIQIAGNRRHICICIYTHTKKEGNL